MRRADESHHENKESSHVAYVPGGPVCQQPAH